MRTTILASLFLGLSTSAATAIDLAPLWDFARPDVSEQRFRVKPSTMAKNAA